MSFLVAFGAWVAFHAEKYDFPNSVKSISPALSDREIERDNKNKYSLFKITSYVNLGTNAQIMGKYLLVKISDAGAKTNCFLS
jgi:hypothetical protein